MSREAPVYLVRGDDEALVREEVRRLVARLAGDDPLAVEEFEAGEADGSAIVDACQTPALLASRRVVRVRDVGRLGADDVSRLKAYLADPLPGTVVVLVAGGGQTPARLLAAVKEVGEIVEASPRSGKERSQWLARRLEGAPVRLEARAAALVAEHLGEDLARLASLLDMLAAAYGQGAGVGVEEVRPLLGEAGAVPPWDLTEAIDRGDTADALVVLRRLLRAGGRHPLVVMATLHRHYGAMLRLDGSGASGEQEAAALLGIAPFPAKKALTQARRLGHSGIARAIGLLADADLALRGASEWPDELVLEVLVARLSRLVPAPARPQRGAGTRR